MGGRCCTIAAVTRSSSDDAGVLTPPRLVGTEILDSADVDPAVRERSHLDIVRSNAVFGGSRAVLAELREALADLPECSTLLDVGTGLADIPAAARDVAHQHSVRLTTIGLDAVYSLVVRARDRVSLAVCGDALALPFADASVDLVICSQILHHFHGDDARRLIAEITRVARRTVIVADLRRSWLAAVGYWLSSWPLRFHPVTRHDGVVSVLRGFTPRELELLVESVTGAAPRARRHLGFRLTTRWDAHAVAPSGAEGRPRDLGLMPTDRRVRTVDEITVRAPVSTMFRLAADVERWPDLLPHYRFVRMRGPRSDGGGLVEMSAHRPFGPAHWPTWWESMMQLRAPSSANAADASVRFRHVRGITRGMDVEWSFEPIPEGTRVRIVHVWNGPSWPMIGEFAARAVIGPIFVHGIASRTLAGLARAAERSERMKSTGSNL